MGERTDRLFLPLLAAGQSQKEVTHNEMVTLADMLMQSVILGRLASPPASPQAGQCWIVASAATGDWQGREGCLAQWSANGWRYVPAFEGLTVWSLGDTRPLRYCNGRWSDASDTGSVRVGGRQVVGAQQPAILPPSGGISVDAQARTVISAILSALQAHGLISN